MKIHFIGITAILICNNIITYSQINPATITENFFQKFEKEGMESAIDYLFLTNKWLINSQSDIEILKENLSTNLELLGDYYGYYQISKNSIGSDFILYSYLVRFDRQPLRFSILYYKPDKEWRLQNFSFDDNFSDELEESSKAYRFRENLNID